MTDEPSWEPFPRDGPLVERLPVGVFRSTLDGEFVEMNPAFVSLLDADSKEQLMDRDAAEFYADPATRQRLVERLEREGVVSDEEVELTTLAGERIWVSATLRLTTLDGTRFLEGISQDVTRRKRREAELRRYRSMVDAMRDSACIYDEAGRFVVVNRYLAEFYDTTKEALVGKQSPLVDHIRENAADGRDPFCRLVAGETEELRGEHEAEFPGHGHGVVDYRLTRLTVDGQFEGVVGIGRDVTERKQRERELERTNERLDEFASIVSHDLRNPLSVADGRLQLAREECDSDHLDHVSRAHERMTTLTEDLLTLARESDATTEPEAIALGELAETSWKNVSTDDADLVVESDSVVRADRSHAKQLFENLFRNSVEHGSTGPRSQARDSGEHDGSAVTVTVGDLADRSGFFVEDDGPGIPAPERDRVFESGYSARETGTGFGLPIVESVASAHGWEVTLAEGDEGGARFEITGVERAE